MKNKKVTYILGAAVVFIWFLVLKTVKDAMGGDSSGESPVLTLSPKEVFNDYGYKEDTAHLNLNHRDPFGLVKQNDTVKKNKSWSKKKEFVVPKALDWEFITYSGFIRNPGSKKLIGIFTINGRSVMMAEGERIDDVKLLKNQRDSVKVEYKGKTKFIGMH